MNYSRICKYVLLLIITNIALSTLLGLFASDLLDTAPHAYVVANYVVTMSVSLLIFVQFGVKQKIKPYQHACLAALIVLLIENMISVLINLSLDVEQPFFSLLVISVMMMGFEAVMGTTLGIKLRKRNLKS